MGELKKYFGEKLCTTTIPRNIRLAEAPSHGMPALMYDPRSKGAESYIRLAKEILDRASGFGLPASSGQPSAEIFTTEGTEEHRVDTDGEETSEMD
jgi:chromosome partitioning protein